MNIWRTLHLFSGREEAEGEQEQEEQEAEGGWRTVIPWNLHKWKRARCMCGVRIAKYNLSGNGMKKKKISPGYFEVRYFRARYRIKWNGFQHLSTKRSYLFHPFLSARSAPSTRSKKNQGKKRVEKIAVKSKATSSRVHTIRRKAFRNHGIVLPSVHF